MTEPADQISSMMEAMDPAADLGDDAIDELYPLERLEVRIEAGAFTAPGATAHGSQGHSATGIRRHPKVALVSVCLVLTVAIVVAVLAISGTTLNKTPNSRSPKWELVSDQIASWQPVGGSEVGTNLGLECPTASTCYAQDPSSGELKVTSDSGRTWQQLIVAPGVVILTEFSCTSATTCTVMGSPDGDYSGDFSLYTTSDGGQTWTKGGLIPVGQPDFVTCSSATDCLVLGLTIESGKGVGVMVTSDGGQSWTKTSLPQGFYPRTGNCSSADNCLLIGGGSGANSNAMYSNDGGRTWQASSAPAGTGFVHSLSCVSATCFATADVPTPAADASILVTSNSGASFTSLAADGFGNTESSVHAVKATSVSCVSASSCWVSGVVNPDSDATARGFLSLTSDGGQTWNPSQLPGDVTAVDNVSCPDPTTCFALANTLPPSASNTVVSSGFVLLEFQD